MHFYLKTNECVFVVYIVLGKVGDADSLEGTELNKSTLIP